MQDPFVLEEHYTPQGFSKFQYILNYTIGKIGMQSMFADNLLVPLLSPLAAGWKGHRNNSLADMSLFPWDVAWRNTYGNNKYLTMEE